MTECLHKHGICIIRDTRVDEKDNDAYIDLMEEYFEETSKAFYDG